MIHIEIRPASFAQVSAARTGAYIEISDDVQGIANALHAIDPHIRLRYSEAGEHFVIYWASDPSKLAEEDGDSYLIFTAQDLDHRIVKHMEEVCWRCQQPGYSFADELERTEVEAKKQEAHEWTERHGEMYERMAHAMREDLGYNQNRIFVAEGV